MLIIYNGVGVHGSFSGCMASYGNGFLVIEHGDVRYGYVSTTIYTRSVWTVWFWLGRDGMLCAIARSMCHT